MLPAPIKNLVEILGGDPPLEEEWEQVRRIIDAVPPGLAPMQIALHLSKIADKNKDGRPYVSEWPTPGRANPLVVTFFSTTATTPRGDLTPWCAAFVNWCLLRAGKSGTRSAQSGSFRCEAEIAAVPVMGDIAVFGANGEDQLCAGTGHVGFYLRAEPRAGVSGVSVLGGNQGTPLGEIKESWFPVKGSSLTLLSIRSLASMR